MNKFTRCTFDSCGTGMYLGPGIQADIEGCIATNCGTGYIFHQDSDVNMVRSSAVNNQVGVDIIDSKGQPVKSSPIPMSSSSCSYEMQYALAYLKYIVGYDPYE